MRQAYAYLMGAIAGVMMVPTASAGSDLVHAFAVCTGRLSAEMEHSWLVYSDRADQAEAQRNAMADLLLAVTDGDNAVQVLSLRINAKAAHGALLARAAFAEDPAQADRARHLAARHIAGCTAFLLA